ncbi:MAG: alpha/beta hydrolase [Alphaproteobacteria bacterium]|nr:alpha/beta hydrolase [Alphaproteobacteria bacterium]
MTNSFIQIGGGELAVEVEGNGPLIVCSPGIGDTRDAFDPLAGYLVARGYRVARLDLRGHGDSTIGFDRYGDDATARDFLAAIDALGGGPAVLAGNSMSAAAAVIAAGRRPEKLAGLILIGPFLRNSTGELMRRAMGGLFMRPWGPAVWKGYATKLWPGLGEKAKERAARSTSLLTRPGRWPAFQATFAGADHRVVAPWISRVRASVLVVMGDSDPDWKDPPNEAKWIASNFGDVETINVRGAGHAPMLERPDTVSPAVFRYLEKLRESGALGPSHA